MRCALSVAGSLTVMAISGCGSDAQQFSAHDTVAAFKKERIALQRVEPPWSQKEKCPEKASPGLVYHRCSSFTIHTGKGPRPPLPTTMFGGTGSPVASLSVWLYASSKVVERVLAATPSVDPLFGKRVKYAHRGNVIAACFCSKHELAAVNAALKAL